ncbi:MAG TPA: 16S rRNA (adenine(1518)-N(6)/adenine(1519)-N(6))-dimethyltransferase RsmA [Candidatus Paceibacterota bacterium]
MIRAKKFSKKISPDRRFRAKKSLGQHFLTDQAAINTSVSTAQLTPEDTVLEVGPGEGVLTAALLETGARVIAVEKDDRLIGLLTEKFHADIKNKKLELIHTDILDFSLQAKKLRSYKLIANIPYYLTGQIIRQFLTAINQPISMTLMLQKEVAERIVAKDKRESLLSVSIKCYGRPHYIHTVPRGAFRPAPRVDSAIIQIDNISRDRFNENGVTEPEFFALLHRGFAAPRKMLGPKLMKFGLGGAKLTVSNVSLQARAENLTVDQWFSLAKQIKNI